MKKHILSLVLLLVLAFNALAEDIVILYDNDVHCAVSGYAQMGFLRDEAKKTHKYVTTVSCGDFLQGDVIGSESKGEAIIDIMNSVGYDYVIPGNHEFDYGGQQMMSLMKRLKAKALSCNILRTKNNAPLFQTCATVDYGSHQVAFIGITTPTTPGSSLPNTFLDSLGNTAFTFCWDNLAERLQYIVDSIRTSGIDYIVLLSHIGTEPDAKGLDIISLAAATHGIDVILDGHSHSVIPMRKLKNANNEEVILSQTGTRFANIGRLTITDNGVMKTELIPVSSVKGSKAETAALIDELNKNLSRMTSRVIGKSRVDLTINTPEGDRAIRSEETNFGDFVADALRFVSGSDVAFINGGSIRLDIPAGNITYGQLRSAMPFDNTVMTAHATGQKILDILEASVATLPDETGSFQQVSGITFDIDTTIPSPVRYNKDGFVKNIKGARRVSNVRIWNSDRHVFETLDPTHVYSIATINYALINRGCEGAFAGCTLDGKTIGETVQVVEKFLKKNLSGNISEEYRKAGNRINIK